MNSRDGQMIDPARHGNLVPTALDYRNCFRDGYATQAVSIKVCPEDFSGTINKEIVSSSRLQAMREKYVQH